MFALIFGHLGKQLDKKVKISKFIMSQTGKEFITIHILPNISKNKRQSGNKIWSVIMKNSFPQKSCAE